MKASPNLINYKSIFSQIIFIIQGVNFPKLSNKKCLAVSTAFERLQMNVQFKVHNLLINC